MSGLAEVPHSVCIIDEAVVRFVRAAASSYYGGWGNGAFAWFWAPSFLLLLTLRRGSVPAETEKRGSACCIPPGVSTRPYSPRYLFHTMCFDARFRWCGGLRTPGMVVEVCLMNQNGLIPPFFGYRDIRLWLHCLGILSAPWESPVGLADLEGRTLQAVSA